MQGKRVDNKELHLLEPGEYTKLDGGWYACSPNGEPANLTGHQVEEHEDGTITVSPSIGIRKPRAPNFLYHGYLKSGVWSDA
jgi:hypothetical protein